MSANITNLSELHLNSKIMEQVREIFFESSTKKDFKDEAEKESFYEKYLGFYLRHYPELAWVALDDGQVLGYLVGTSSSCDEELMRIQPHLSVFKKYYKNYPAHLHINCHAQSRGQGIGAQLVKAFEERLKTMNIGGFHIMTGPDALNKKFYQKLGLDFEVVENFHASPILFMGKSL